MEEHTITQSELENIREKVEELHELRNASQYQSWHKKGEILDIIFDIKTR